MRLYFNNCEIIALIILVSIIAGAFGKKPEIKGFDVTCKWKPSNTSIKAYWINLDSGSARKVFMQKQLEDLKILNSRVEAIVPNSSRFNITKLEKPCNRNTNKDIAVIASHLTAIHSAVYDTEGNSDYAIIFEDDIRFKFDIDFDKLIQTAPKDFGVLQLMTSNIEAIHKLWSSHISSSSSSLPQNTSRLWTPSYWDSKTKDKKTVLFWSAQAYIVNKRVVKPFIDDVVHSYLGPTGRQLSFRIINSFSPSRCIRTREYPCILANCLFSDSYIYAGAGPTYVLNVPLFNGDIIGFNSSVHQEQVDVHKDAFIRIQHLVNKLKSGNVYLPTFMNVPECQAN